LQYQRRRDRLASLMASDDPPPVTASEQVNDSDEWDRAEFGALRAEIISRSSTQTTLLGIGAAAMTAIAGVSLSDHPRKGLLLALAPIAAVINGLWAIENWRIASIGAYIESHLLSGGWEAHHRQGALRWIAIVLDAVPLIGFTVAAGIGLRNSDVTGRLHTVAFGLIVASVAVPLLLAGIGELVRRRG
jgi:hypothetical protein